MSLENTLDLIKAAQATPDAALSKAITQSTGLVAYDLQAPAKSLYPFSKEITPLQASLPRIVSNAGGTATNWKSIVSLNANNTHPGVSEGNRGGQITETVNSVTAAYVGLGLENSLSFEADYAATGFQDLKAQAMESTLRALILQEEKMLFAGNGSVALGTTPTPTTALVSGGSLPDAAYVVYCVALTASGYQRAAVSATGVIQSISRTNSDGSTDTINAGAAGKSVAGTTRTTASTNNSVSATVTPVLGAVAYAWYIGTAAAERLHSITTINSQLFTTVAGATNQLFSALSAGDFSAEGVYSFDGLLYQGGFKSGSGAYLATLATGTAGTGTTLTTNSAGGVAEIDTALASFWDNYKLSPDNIWCNSAQLKKITSLIIANGGAPIVRFNSDANNTIVNGGAAVGSYLNQITQSLLKLRVHPNCPAGSILFTSDSIPYPLSGVGRPAEVRCRRDYYAIEFPMTSRKYQYATYVDETLVHYFPPCTGIITNIA